MSTKKILQDLAKTLWAQPEVRNVLMQYLAKGIRKAHIQSLTQKKNAHKGASRMKKLLHKIRPEKRQ